MAGLTIYKRGTVSAVRCEVSKWEFQDKAMGEQYVMFTLASPVPIPFAVGDWCQFRGQTYTLNVEPTCTQKSRPGTHGEAFTYENVKFNSPQDDMTRCIVLDIVPTSGEHQAAYGTNYTGSANFTLNCFETLFEYQGNTIYYAPVHALLDRIKANLDRLYPGDPGYPDTCWQVYIDDRKCHSDDKILTFSNWTVEQALAEVHNTFKLDYVVRGKKIIVGDISEKYPELAGVVGYVTDLDDNDEPLFFGYGKGYLSESNQGKGLFQIKKVSKNDQQVITRLRAVGSTKNMPYRYYHNTYGTQEEAGGLGLPQTMFVQNLQLPDTFLPPTADEGQESKATGNARRDIVYGEGVVRHVLGDTNDAYIDKGDDAALCPEGVREAVARWDGSDGDLPEIFPTIEEATYGELRANNVADIDGTKGSNAYPHYGGTERIDEILDIVPGDCNIGDGVMTESEAYGMTSYTAVVNCVSRDVSCDATFQRYDLFTIGTTQEKGNYILSYTTQVPMAFVTFNPGRYGGSSIMVSANISLVVNIYQVPLDGSARSRITWFSHAGNILYASGSYGRSSTKGFEFVLPSFHDTEEEWGTESLTVTKPSTIEAELLLTIGNVAKESADITIDWTATHFAMGVKGSDQTQDVRPEAIWQPSSSSLYYSSTPFHIMLKDLGMSLPATAAIDGGDITLSMKSGQCAGREFVVKTASIEPYTQAGGEYVEDNTGKKGWRLELERVNDESIHAYFPSENSKILPGDQFVLLNISLPDAYIKAAESRLLVAATEHLADNCDTQYTYQPSVNDLYLQRNIDRHVGDPENSVFWRLYAGMKFPFFGIPKDDGDPLPIADITIESVSIKMGDKITPQVDITLNDNLEQSTIQRLQTTVDRLYGSVFSLGGVTYPTSSAVSDATIYHFGSKHFLSKTEDDTASGNITFEKGIDVKTLASIMQAYIGGAIGSSTFESGMLGRGWKIDTDRSSMELDEITVRKTMRAFELLIQKARSVGGEILVSPANGTIKSVRYIPPSGQTEGHYYIEIESGEDGTSAFGNMFKVNDWLRCQRWDQGLNSLRSYWAMVTWVQGNFISLPSKYFNTGQGGVIAPSAGDELVLMGSQSHDPADANRKNAISITAADNGNPKITIYEGITGVYNPTMGYDYPTLDGCTRAVLGDLSGITDEDMGALEGYGLYSDNVYLKGKLAFPNGTLISDEITRINSDEFEVHRLSTIPDTSVKSENRAHIEIHDSLMEVFNEFGRMNIRFGVDSNGYSILEYLDNYGNILYNLGPDGLTHIEWQDARFEAVVYNAINASHAAGGDVDLYLYYARRFNGQIQDDGDMTAELGEQANGRWFNHNRYQDIIENGALTDFASGKYQKKGDAARVYASISKYGSVEDFKGFLTEEYGITDFTGISFALEGDGETLSSPIYVQEFYQFTNGGRDTTIDIWQ